MLQAPTELGPAMTEAAAMENAPVPRELFGGALTAAVPARFVDVSRFRQVPDTQEVFSDAETDQSVIVELLEMAEAPDEAAALFHFNSLATDNAALSVVLEQEPIASPLENGGTRTVCWGLQTVSKFNEGADSANQVRVHVACFRLPHIATDIVVSYNTPVFISDGSSSAEQVDPLKLATTNSEACLETFTNVWGSLQVLDYSIFQA